MRSKEMEILFEALTEGADTQKLIRIGHEEIFKNPIMITNAAFKVIAMESRQTFNDPVWTYACTYGCCSNESIDIFGHDKAADRLFHEENAFIYDWNIGKNIPRILARIEFKGHIFGYIIIFAVNQPFRSYDLELANMFCHSLRVVLSAANDHSLENTFSDQLMLKLLNHEYHNDQVLTKELELANWRLLPNMICLCMERSKTKNSRYYVYHLKRTINQISDQIKTILFEDHLVALYQYVRETDIEWMMEQMNDILRKHDIRMGISQSFHCLSEMPLFYSQSLIALTVGNMMKPSDCMYSYNELLPFSLFYQLPIHSVKTMIIPEFYQLKTFDKKHQTSFSDTLYCYFYEGLNLKTTANKLHVHRNTMTYRITKIEEIIKRKVNDMIFLEQYALARNAFLWCEKFENR